jgi:excisionase family DNA binding protein
MKEPTVIQPVAERLPQWLTRAEVAQYYRITTRGVDKLRADGRLRAYTLGYLIRFRREDVEAALRPID